MKRYAIAGGAVALTLSLAACSSETAAPIVSESAPVEISDEIPTESPAGETTDAPTEEDTETEAPGDSTMVPVGTTVSVGDWDVTVTKVAKNADKAIASANMFNDDPEGRFVLVTYTATYQGDQRKSDVEADLTWSFTGSDQVSYDAASQVTPADDRDAPTDARKGGTVTTDVVFDVPADQIDGGIISVEGYDANFDQIYADFTF